MNQDYIKPHDWSIIEEGFVPGRVKSSESLFSLGNGAMEQRTNFEEEYTGATFQGSYIAGVYYPDKTKVGWWKNGYTTENLLLTPEFLNSGKAIPLKSISENRS